MVLTVENDGVERGRVPSTPTSGGSGLAGLRERLSAVDGTLEAGPVDGDLFRVVAVVPLPPGPPRFLLSGLSALPSSPPPRRRQLPASSSSSSSLSSVPRSVNEEVTP